MNPSEALHKAKALWARGPPEYDQFIAFLDAVPLKRVWRRAFLFLDQANGDFDRAIALAEAKE